MARLIDAEKLNFHCNYNGDCSGDVSHCKECDNYVLDYRDIQEQPTAYDVDKVVKEINEWTFNANIDVGDGTIMNHNLIVRDTAINIVKAGGNS
jgi:hypothetical protein